ncbi:MAG: hypothetical protein JJP05_02715 [cyanobacterium endosymbiont of Rhopalodia gibba]
MGIFQYGNIVVFPKSETIKASVRKVWRGSSCGYLESLLKNYPLNELYIPELLRYRFSPQLTDSNDYLVLEFY